MISPAAGAAFLPERLAKSAWVRVLTLVSDRADFTENFASIPAQIRWLELEQWPFEVRKNDQNNSWLKTRYKKLNKSWSAVNLQV